MALLVDDGATPPSSALRRFPASLVVVSCCLESASLTLDGSPPRGPPPGAPGSSGEATPSAPMCYIP